MDILASRIGEEAEDTYFSFITCLLRHSQNCLIKIVSFVFFRSSKKRKISEEDKKGKAKERSHSL